MLNGVPPWCFLIIELNLFQIDIFEIEAVDLSDIEKLVVGHNGPDDGKGWFLEEAILRVPEPDDSPDEENSNNNNNEEGVQYKAYSFTCKRYSYVFLYVIMYLSTYDSVSSIISVSLLILYIITMVVLVL